jgi:hypothetical protein
MNLLEDYKTQITSVMSDIFDTFKRASLITFYKVNDEEVVILDPEFNADLQEYDAINTNLVEVSQQFECRIIFPKRESSFHTSVPNLSVPIKSEQDFAEVYLQVKEDAYNFLKDTVRFQFMGENYQMMSPIRPIGFLDTFNVYQIYLKKVA